MRANKTLQTTSLARAMVDEVPLPESLRNVELGHPHGHDYHLVDVRLHDGRRFFRLPLVGGTALVGTKTTGKDVRLDFSGNDIAEIRRASFGIKSFFGWW